ncbi:MAG: MFS transporter [Holophagales bacterium]|jgi:MFS family permease|nr:MFS transporter [Holophagales bacterium]
MSTRDKAVERPVFNMRYLLLIAGLGGLLYGIDVGIIAGALPYLESSASMAWKLSAQQLSFVVAAVLLGSVLSSLFAGMLADLFGRKSIMILSGLLFTLSIPVIALASGYAPLLYGRLLQGVSGGLIGVVVPLYLAEGLGASNRGKGTGIFQLLLTIGLVVAALIGLFYASQVENVEKSVAAMADTIARSEAIFKAKDHAWRSIFWMSVTPGIIFTVGAFFISESPRWLFKKGKRESALKALRKTRTESEADVEFKEMEAAASSVKQDGGKFSYKDSLLSRKYVIPFILACLILALTQATGINSILAYIVNILNNAGLPGSIANWGDLSVKTLNVIMTLVAVALVDRKGRKFLLSMGSGGIVISLLIAGLLFFRSERNQTDIKNHFNGLIQENALTIPAVDSELLTQAGFNTSERAQQLTIVYSYGPFTNVQTRRTDDVDKKPLVINRRDTVQEDSVIGRFFRKIHLNPFADPDKGANASLVVEKALIGPVPSQTNGWLTAICILAFISFYAAGPGVCVWLALSELMPTRIRSNGMSIALLINQFVSTTIAAVFLPMVGSYGYAAMFFFWSGCTVIYFLTAAFFLPETKGKTLEEIEAHFEGDK